MAAILGYLGMVVGTIGVFFGFYYIGDEPTSITIVTVTTVGVVGVLSFVRHLFFHQSDAKRLGWETDRPDWAFEVGFANLAFGIAALVATIGQFSVTTQAIVLLGYSLYLLQAAILHGYRYFTDPVRVPSKLWRSCIATLLFAALMLFFAIRAFSVS